MSTRPHDALFRETFGHPEHARGELQHLLPAAVSALIDWSTLTLVPGSFVDEALKDSQSDLMFSVRLAGRTAFLYLLLEHQSSVDLLLVFRQLKYEVRFWDTWIKDHPGESRLPVVIPMLLTHAPGGWTAATRFEDLLDFEGEVRELLLDHVPRFRVLVDDLTTQTDESLRARPMTRFARIVLWCLLTARSFDQLAAGWPGWVPLMGALWAAADGRAAIDLVLRYLFIVHHVRKERIVALLDTIPDDEQRHGMQSIADQFREEGLEQGKRAVLLRLLELRFGPLRAEARSRIQRAPCSDLDQWTDRVLTASTLDEVLGSVA